jgi:hypothetical protein
METVRYDWLDILVRSEAEAAGLRRALRLAELGGLN